MTTDRELLEAAAKAAGYGEVWSLADHPDVIYVGPRYKPGQPVQYRVWNPLTDDGDALRLAVRLNIGVQSHAGRGDYSLADDGSGSIAELHNGDPQRATRRAIVMAAAEIGRRMKWPLTAGLTAASPRRGHT